MSWGSGNRLLLFTGSGKGKTTAALGMAVRAVGHGQRVLFVQFVKANAATGELAAARYLPGVRLVQVGLGFVPPPTHPAYPAHRQAAAQGLALVERALQEGAAEMVVLDEVCVAVARGLLEGETVLAAVAKAGLGTTIVLTGRDAPDVLVDAADTVTDMACTKHALGEGHRADAGVEW